MNSGKGSGFEFEDGRIIRKQSGDEKEEIVLTPGTESNRMLEEFRESRARKIAIRRTVAVCMIAAVILMVVSVVILLFFRIDEVTVTGSGKFSEEQLVSSLGLSRYSNLLLTGKGRLESRLRESFPSLDSISIEKRLPDKLIITVTDGVGRYYMTAGGDCYILSEELKALEKTDTVPDGLVELVSCDVVSVITGREIRFRTTTHYGYLTGLLKAIDGHSISEHIVKVDMSEKFNVKLRYDDRFVIIIGDAENANTKLTLAERLISTLSADEKGIIDASDLEISSFRKTDDIG